MMRRIRLPINYYMLLEGKLISGVVHSPLNCEVDKLRNNPSLDLKLSSIDGNKFSTEIIFRERKAKMENFIFPKKKSS